MLTSSRWRLRKKGCAYFKQMFMFPFHNPILLRGLDNAGLMYDPSRSKEIHGLIAQAKFQGIITSYDLDSAVNCVFAISTKDLIKYKASSLVNIKCVQVDLV